jgi:hypothetical protein
MFSPARVKHGSINPHKYVEFIWVACMAPTSIWKSCIFELFYMIILMILIFSQKILQEPWNFSKHDSILFKDIFRKYLLVCHTHSAWKNIKLQIACPLIKHFSRILTKSVIYVLSLIIFVYICLGPLIWTMTFSDSWIFYLSEKTSEFVQCSSLKTLHPVKCLKPLLSIIVAHCPLIRRLTVLSSIAFNRFG